MSTPTARSAAQFPGWRDWPFALAAPVVSPIAVAIVAACWAWQESFAHSLLEDWWRFYRRALAQALTRSTFWPHSGWFYEGGMITWSWDARAQTWARFGGRVCIRSH